MWLDGPVRVCYKQAHVQPLTLEPLHQQQHMLSVRLFLQQVACRCGAWPAMLTRPRLLLLLQVDMSDVLRLKHARHNAQPTARQQLQQQQDSPVSAAAAGLGIAGGPGSSDAPQVLRRVCPAFKGWKQHQRPGSCAAVGVEALGRKVRAEECALSAPCFAPEPARCTPGRTLFD